MYNIARLVEVPSQNMDSVATASNASEVLTRSIKTLVASEVQTTLYQHVDSVTSFGSQMEVKHTSQI